MINNIDVIKEHSDEESDDGEFEERKKQRLQILQKVQEIWREGNSINDITQQKILKDDFYEELEEEFEHEYEQHFRQLPETIFVDLVQMNELQKAYIYSDSYPFLEQRKKLLIYQKRFSWMILQLTRHQIFEFITLLVILYNSVLLALDDPTTETQSTFQNQMDVMFLVLYTIEAVLKIIGMGFLFNRGAYLRDLWNILDFSVIVTGYLPYVVDNSGVNLSALRSLRVLRPLRTISSVKALRSIIKTLFTSFGELSNALIVLGFSYTIFAIAGLSMFMGYAKQRCFNDVGIIQMTDFDTDEPYCGDCSSGFICGKMMENPQKGFISFDNFGISLLQVFVTTTLEGWSSIMEAVRMTFSQYVVFYFALIVIIGAFFLVNLTLAIIKINFSNAENNQEEIEEEEQCYSMKQLKRLGIYRSKVHYRRQSSRPTLKTYMPKQTHQLNTSSQNNSQMPVVEPPMKPKVHFKPLYIREFSRPVHLKNNVKLHGIQGVKQEQNPQTPMIAQQSFVPPPLNKQFSSRRTVFRNSIKVQEDPFDEFEQMLRSQTKKTSMLMRQDSHAISPARQLNNLIDNSKTPYSKEDSGSVESPVTRKHATVNTLIVPQSNGVNKFNFIMSLQKSFNEEDENVEKDQEKRKLSVTLSELDSISDQEVEARFEEFDISFQQVKSNDKTTEEDQRRQPANSLFVPSPLIRKKKQEPRDDEISKDDEKLKIRLLQAKLIPRVRYDEYVGNSGKDVLAKQEYRKRMKELANREKKIKLMKFKLTYTDIENRLQNIKKQQQIVSCKTIVLQNGNSKKVLPLNEELTPLQATDVKRRPNTRRRTNIFKRLSYQDYVRDFQKEFEPDQKLTDLCKEVNDENEVYKIPHEERYQDQAYFQQYHHLKNQDLQDRELKSESSISDVLFASSAIAIYIKALNYDDSAYYIYLAGITGIIKNIRKKIFYLIDSKFFSFAMNLSVAINTIILALDGLVDNQQLLDDFNFAFTVIFTIEMGLKLIGMGVLDYIRDMMNVFDAIIVAVSLADVIFFSGGSAFKSIKIMRTFRVLRITKLMRSLRFMNFLIQVLSNAFQSLMYIFLLLFIFIYIFTLLGMSFFGGQLTYQVTGIRQNFDSFFDSFMVVFQVLTLENWNGLLYALMGAQVNNVLVIGYLIVWIFIGNYVLLNLFLASLLDNFEVEYMRMHEQLREEQSNLTMLKDTSQNTMATSVAQPKQFTYYSESNLCLYSLYLFHQENAIRKLCYKTVKNSYFDQMILIAIVLSSIKLVIDTYVSNFGTEIDIFFAYFFGFEFMLKIISFGFVTEQNSYLRDGWNVMDFIIVLVSFVDIYVEGVDLSFVKILRLLRTLRPLRFISHNKSMKLLVNTLINSISGIVNVGVVVILVWMMFAILGVNLQKGKMWYCDTGSDNWFHVQQCAQENGVWKNRDMNFDNVFSGFLTLFIISTLEGWPDQMFWFIDADESGPIWYAQTQFAWYFVVFILIGSILLMNLFVGVILVNYKLSEEDAKDKSVSQIQEDWIHIQKLIIQSNPNFAVHYPPNTALRAFFFRVVSHRIFDTTIMTIIILNIIVMAMNYEGASTEYNYALYILNLIFSVIFIVEAVLKLIGFGVMGYFRNGWNQFDFFVVLTSILDIMLDIIGSGSSSMVKVGPQIARVFRVLRVTRLFRLVKQLHGLRKLIDTALFSLPALLNVTALMFLLYFIFSILGVFLFSSVKTGGVINSEFNFSNFHMAFLLLFRCTTGEDWQQVMYDVMNAQGAYTCVYFIVFTLIMQMIMLNLFILIILDQYEQFYFNSDNPLQRFQEYESDFVEIWAPLAAQSNGSQIDERQLVNLMLRIRAPLGYDLQEKISKAVADWKTYNNDSDSSLQNLERIRNLVTAEGKRMVAKQIMKMSIIPNVEGYLEYHYVLFMFMKSFQKNLMDNITPEGGVKLQKREDLTLSKIRKGNIKEEGVNPCVKLMFVMMCFKAYKRYAIKLKEKVHNQNEFSDASSNTSYLHQQEIEQRQSVSESIGSMSEYQHKFMPPPDLSVYQGDVNVQFKSLEESSSSFKMNVQNISEISEGSSFKKIDLSNIK